MATRKDDPVKSDSLKDAGGGNTKAEQGGDSDADRGPVADEVYNNKIRP